MPITVTIPVQGDGVGPGTRVEASSSLGVIPAGAHWDALVFSAGTSDRELISALDFSNTPSRELILGRRVDAEGQSAILQPQDAFPAVGGEHELRVRLISAESTIIDISPPIGVVWRPDPWGTAYVQSLEAQGGGTTGGFTSADRIVLEAIQAATQLTVPGVGLLQLVNLIANLPPSFHGRELITPDRTGDGSLTRPGGLLAVNASGLYWEIVSKAPGIGIDEGAPDVTEIRALELRFVLQLADGTLFTDEHRSYGEGNTAWMWGARTPARIDYNITPGVSVRFWWLLVGAGAWLPGSVPLELFLPRFGPFVGRR